MRASRWNGKKIDHVSHLNNISGTTAKSRGERQLMFIGFFFFPAPSLGLERARSQLLHHVCTKREKSRGKRKEMRNMGKAVMERQGVGVLGRR